MRGKALLGLLTLLEFPEISVVESEQLRRLCWPLHGVAGLRFSAARGHLRGCDVGEPHNLLGPFAQVHVSVPREPCCGRVARAALERTFHGRTWDLTQILLGSEN